MRYGEPFLKKGYKADTFLVDGLKSTKSKSQK